MDIERVDGSGGQELLDYVLSNPRTLLYSSPAYLHLISRHLNADAFWLISRDKGQIKGALPIAKRDGPLGPVFNSMAYYGSNGGVVQNEVDEKAKIALINAFYSNASDAGACSATIINNPLEQDSAFYESIACPDFRDERIGQITHFPESGEEGDLLTSFSNPRPRNIRKAIKEGVAVTVSKDVNALEFLYQVHCENMHIIGGQEKSWDFFSKVKTQMPEDSWDVHLATLKGQPIGALLLFYFNQTVEYFTPVILAEHRGTQALALIIFGAMNAAMQKGFRHWNWGGTWLSQEGVYDFKKRWGSTEYPYYYYTKVFNQDILYQPRESLINDYFGFYVLPFNKLKGE